MPENNENEILKEQRKARESYLELKKMQSGEIDPGPKPSEVAIVPKTIGQKFKHFWYYHKKTVFVSLFLVIVITVMTVQCAMQPKYDLQVVVFTYDFILDEDTKKMAKYFEKYCEDINGDGEVNVKVINCSYSEDSDTQSYRKNKITRLQQVIASEKNAMLYITDSESVEYFETLDDGKPFLEEKTVKLDDEFYKTSGLADSSYFGSERDLSVSCRRIDGTMIDKSDETKNYYKHANMILDKLIKKSES